MTGVQTCALPIYNKEAIVLNNEKYQRIKEEETTIDWIANEAIIMREEGSGTRKEAEKQLRRAGIDVEKLNVVASIENSEAIKKSVKSGIGITMISRLAVQDVIESGQVLDFPLSSKDDGRDLNLVYNKNYQLSNSAERFIRVVKEMYNI